MLGMALAIGAVALTFAQDAPPKQENGKKGKKRISDEPKKDLR